MVFHLFQLKQSLIGREFRCKIALAYHLQPRFHEPKDRLLIDGALIRCLNRQYGCPLFRRRSEFGGSSSFFDAKLEFAKNWLWSRG